MKGALVLVWALVIFTLASVSLVTGVRVYRYRINVEVNYEYKYDNVQLALLTLLSSTHDEEQVAKLLAEHLALGQQTDMKSILQDKLDEIFENECYNLTVSDLVVTGANTKCAKKYAAKARMVYPYNPENLTEDVFLVVG